MDTKHIHCMLEDIAEYGKAMISSMVGDGNVNLQDLGEIVDMVKDLAEAEYHALIAKSMREYEEEEKEEEKYMLRMLKEEHEDEYKRMREEYGEDEGERRFYDNYRYKSSGRFAPKGRGTRYGKRGYMEPPYLHMPCDYRYDVDDYGNMTAERMRDMDRDKGRLYFSEPMMNPSHMRDMRNDGWAKENRPESRYERAKRGYEEVKEAHRGNTPEDKQLTMREAEKVLNVVFDEIDEMLSDASPEMKNMVKTRGMSRLQKIQ